MRSLLSIAVFLIAGLATVPTFADDRLVRLAAPQALSDNGFLKFVLPRFSLKSQVKVKVLPNGAVADVSIGELGRPLFERQGETFFLNIVSADHPGTQKFADWITSEVGLRTIESFKIDGVQVYASAKFALEVEETIDFEGDAALGKKLSVVHCGRCHVTQADRSMGGIGSTPSFAVLRAMEDWDYRFQAFFALNPHPSFTQIVDLTEDFPEDRPSPIVPIVITLDEFDAILAYVSAIAPADLGAPLKTQ